MDVFTLVGRIAIEGQEKVTEGINRLGDAAERHSRTLKVVGAGLTAIGAAGLKFVESAREMNAQLAQTGITVGATTKEMRDLALSVTNVTFPLESVAATFEILARAGVKNLEEMKANANAFDALADATGSSAEAVADVLIPAYKLFGQTLPQSSNEMDKFTWLTRRTTVDLTDFGNMLVYLAPQMKNLNIQMDDAIVLLAALESRGIQGSAATRVFRSAVTEATNSGRQLNDVLGISQEEIERFRKEMNEATGITDEYAEAANSQYGIMAKLKQTWSELTLRLGSFLTPLEPILAAMTAMGPVMIFLSTAVGRNTIAWVANTAALIANKTAAIAARVAMFALANISMISFGIIGAAAVAAGVAIYYFTRQTDEMVAKAQGLNNAATEHAQATMRAKFADEQWVEGLKNLGEEQKTIIRTLIERIGLMAEMPDKVRRYLYEWGDALKYVGINAQWLANVEADAGRIIDETNEAIRDQQIASFWAANEKRGLADVAKALSMTEEDLQAAISRGNNALDAQKTSASGAARALEEYVVSAKKAAMTAEEAAAIIESLPATREYTPAEIAYFEKRGYTAEQLAGIPSAQEIAAAFYGMVGTGGTISGYQHGGVISEPTLLYGLASKRPYAIAGEAGREYVTPERGGAVNIFVELDGRVIGRAIGQPLVDEIRIKTGVHI